MARKATTKRITRRDAMALLGAGTVMEVVRPAPASAKQPHPECNRPADVETYRSNTREAIVSFSCCQETKNAILVGVEEPRLKPTQTGRMHLTPLRDRLITDNLLEYCFMIWGLDEKQVQALYKSVPVQLAMEQVKRPVKK